MILYYITDRQQFPGTEAVRRERLLAKIAEAVRAGVDYVQLRELDLASRDLEELARAAVEIVRNANQKPTANVPGTRLLINSRTDVALAAGADGVHLRASDIGVADARSIWKKASAMAGVASTSPICHPERSEGPALVLLHEKKQQVLRFAQDDKLLGPTTNERIGLQAANRRLVTDACLVAVSCHTPEEARLAETQGADFAVFAPVFEKAGVRRAGSGVAALQLACNGVSRMPVLALGGVTLQNARACLEAGAAGVAGIRLFQDYDIEDSMAKLRRIFI